jgi:hypothetical protein
MELLELTGPVRVTGDHMLVIPHGRTTLDRGLEHGESVVLKTAQGEMYAAQVLDIGFEPEDTVYTLHVGARLPKELAEERIAGLDPAVHDLAMHELVDLLGQLAHKPELYRLGICAVS